MSDSGEGKERHWFPYSYRNNDKKDRIDTKYCLILLNQPILDPALAVRYKSAPSAWPGMRVYN